MTFAALKSGGGIPDLSEAHLSLHSASPFFIVAFQHEIQEYQRHANQKSSPGVDKSSRDHADSSKNAAPIGVSRPHGFRLSTQDADQDHTENND
jgi:hypothetical protein